MCTSKKTYFLKTSVAYLIVFLLSAGVTFAQSSPEQEIKQLSMDKWQWMADKDVAKLEKLFDDKAKFAHMSGTWSTDRELEIIATGSIWYKKADVHDTAIEIFGTTALV